jgi:hypothetical protein
VTGLLFASVVLIAAATWIARGASRRAARRRAQEGPGTSADAAIAVRAFDDIDRAVAARRCHCGASLRTCGEGSRQEGTRRLRFARLACDECEEISTLYFDVSEVLH